MIDLLPITSTQLVLAAFGMAGAAAALVSAVLLKGRYLPSVGRALLRIHRATGWATLAIYLFLAATCLYFHFPFGDPLSIFDMGGFVVHPLAGPLGAVAYAGKIIAVERRKLGWKLPGTLWGTALFGFWLIQFATVLPAYRVF